MTTSTIADDWHLTRRKFVKLAAATGIAVGAGSLASGSTSEGGMPYRALGRTGERVSAIGLGGYHIGKQPEEQESIRLIRSAIDGTTTGAPAKFVWERRCAMDIAKRSFS